MTPTQAEVLEDLKLLVEYGAQPTHCAKRIHLQNLPQLAGKTDGGRTLVGGLIRAELDNAVREIRWGTQELWGRATSESTIRHAIRLLLALDVGSNRSVKPVDVRRAAVIKLLKMPNLTPDALSHPKSGRGERAILEPLAAALMTRAERAAGGPYTTVSHASTFYLTDDWAITKVETAVEIEARAPEVNRVEQDWHYRSDPNAVIEPRVLLGGTLADRDIARVPDQAYVTATVRLPTLISGDRHIYCLSVEVATEVAAFPAVWNAYAMQASMFRLIFAGRKPSVVWGFDGLSSEMAISRSKPTTDAHVVRPRPDGSYYKHFSSYSKPGLHGLAWA